MIAHQHHKPCLAEDLCCDSDDSDFDPAFNCLPPIGAWYMPQPVPVYPPPHAHAKDGEQTFTESMFSYDEDIPSTELVQYSSITDLKKKRVIKAARK